MTEIPKFIKNLQTSKLYAGCPHCGDEFSLNDAILFDGTKKFPESAEITRLEWENELQERISKLKVRKNRAITGSEKTTVAVGIGKIIEKILPAHKNFNMVSSDCRFLAEPIDMIVFRGACQQKINHITFMDIKTGNARLNQHQKMVCQAINDHDVKWKVL